MSRARALSLLREYLFEPHGEADVITRTLPDLKIAPCQPVKDAAPRREEGGDACAYSPPRCSEKGCRSLAVFGSRIAAVEKKTMPEATLFHRCPDDRILQGRQR